MDRAEQIQAETIVRRGPLVGREAYEASLAACPTYHDGRPRRTWEQLGDVERQSWEHRLSYIDHPPRPDNRFPPTPGVVKAARRVVRAIDQ